MNYLDKNENFLGCSASVYQAISDVQQLIYQYPQIQCLELKTSIADKNAVTSDNVIVTNGSDELLFTIARVFAGPELEIIIPATSFVGFSVAAKWSGATAVMAPMNDMHICLDAIKQRTNDKTRVIFIANPNNPTGTYLELEQIKAFLAELPSHIKVVLDEAYIEYMLEDHSAHVAALLAAFPNLIFTRTFSKAYGLAGLRLGYGMASTDIIAQLNQLRPPFNVNQLAQVAGVCALADEAHLKRAIEVNLKHKHMLYQGLSELGAKYIETATNFVCAQFDCDMPELHQYLQQQSIFCQLFYCADNQPYFRVSTAPRAQQASFLAAVKSYLS